jgi:hypothetical protein
MVACKISRTPSRLSSRSWQPSCPLWALCRSCYVSTRRVKMMFCECETRELSRGAVHMHVHAASLCCTQNARFQLTFEALRLCTKLLYVNACSFERVNEYMHGIHVDMPVHSFIIESAGKRACAQGSGAVLLCAYTLKECLHQDRRCYHEPCMGVYAHCGTRASMSRHMLAVADACAYRGIVLVGMSADPAGPCKQQLQVPDIRISHR